MINKWPYLLWFLLYFLLFGFLTNFIVVGVVYFVLIIFSLTDLAEGLWRFLSGIRPLRTRKEKERLLPLFKEVHDEVTGKDLRLYVQNIKLYILEDMEVNAFAFGKRTMVITRGSIELLNDDCLKGLIAHEFGHFANGDTTLCLIANVGNILPSLLLKFFALLARIFWPFNIIYKPLQFLNDFILFTAMRKREYSADEFAIRSGFGREMVLVLYEFYTFIVEKPSSIKEQVRKTHPPLTKRIELLEQDS